MVTLYIFLSMVVTSQAQMEGFVVGGSFSEINNHPHSAFLLISCNFENGKKIYWRCGASILNQRILLTAAHCVDSCNWTTHVIANMGNKHRENGVVRSASGFLIHAMYDTETIACDIAMIKMSKSVKFSSKISRVAIMQNPPYRELAKLAGWGQVDDETSTQTVLLKELSQKVIKHYLCEQLFGAIMPRGTICAISDAEDNFAASGDSGSALVVRGYIQIGIASFKVPSTIQNVLIYTDIGYHYK